MTFADLIALVGLCASQMEANISPSRTTGESRESAWEGPASVEVSLLIPQAVTFINQHFCRIDFSFSCSFVRHDEDLHHVLPLRWNFTCEGEQLCFHAAHTIHIKATKKKNSWMKNDHDPGLVEHLELELDAYTKKGGSSCSFSCSLLGSICGWMVRIKYCTSQCTENRGVNHKEIYIVGFFQLASILMLLLAWWFLLCWHAARSVHGTNETY